MLIAGYWCSCIARNLETVEDVDIYCRGWTGRCPGLFSLWLTGVMSTLLLSADNSLSKVVTRG